MLLRSRQPPSLLSHQPPPLLSLSNLSPGAGSDGVAGVSSFPPILPPSDLSFPPHSAGISSSSSSSSSSRRDDRTTKHTTTLFPSLQEINMYLPKLECFCEWGCAISLPSLKILDINNCDEMKSFNAGSLVMTPALQRVAAYGKDLEYAGDLNIALRQHFEKRKEEQAKEEDN